MINRDIVVIGGSAGATAPLKRILADLPEGMPASILVVRHMHAHGKVLATTLAPGGPLPLRIARDREPVERGVVYSAVPDHHLMLERDRIRLTRGPRENLARPAIDPLFRSAAMAYGPRVIGIVLSGALNDGAAGLQAIRRCGGVTIAQDPAEAAGPEMPHSALEAGPVDHCVPAARMAALLRQLAAEPAGEPVPVPPDIRLEVEIAAGGVIDAERLLDIASPAPLTCPNCHGVLSEVRGASPLRFRCQVGHAYTAQVIENEQDASIDGALRVALRVVEERAFLMTRMARDARAAARTLSAESFEAHADEFRRHADTIRRAAIMSMVKGEPAA